MADTMNAESNPAQSEQIIPISKLWWVGLVAAAAASIANLIFFWVTKSVFGIPYIIPMGGPGGPLQASGVDYRFQCCSRRWGNDPLGHS